MFKLRAVAKVKPTNSCNTVPVLGIGNSFLTCRLFTSLKSCIKCIVLTVFGVIKECNAHSDVGWNSNTPSSQYLCNSLITFSVCTLGTGNDFPLFGLVPSFSSMKMWLVFQSPSVPSKRSSYSVSNCSDLFWSWRLRWVSPQEQSVFCQLFL
jgi:hypothetical protein